MRSTRRRSSKPPNLRTGRTSAGADGRVDRLRLRHQDARRRLRRGRAGARRVDAGRARGAAAHRRRAHAAARAGSDGRPDGAAGRHRTTAPISACSSDGDIALAPLEATRVQRCQEQHQVPRSGDPRACPASARRAPSFSAIVNSGQNGFLAESEADVAGGAAPPGGRRPICASGIGGAARRLCWRAIRPMPSRVDRSRRWSPAWPDSAARSQLRVLVVNIFFWPRSFGGATIVAEETARRLNARDGAEVSVFTSHAGTSAGATRAAALRVGRHAGHRRRVRRAPRRDRRVRQPGSGGAVRRRCCGRCGPTWCTSIPSRGSAPACCDACVELRIPYVVTVHDAWWLCARQFMVRGDGRYCFQTRIDLNVCQACVPQARHLPERLDLLLARPGGAAAVLSPSDAHRALYLANGLDPDRLHVSAERHPHAGENPRSASPVRPCGSATSGAASRSRGFSSCSAAFEALTPGELGTGAGRQHAAISALPRWKPCSGGSRAEFRSCRPTLRTTMDEFFDEHRRAAVPVAVEGEFWTDRRARRWRATSG